NTALHARKSHAQPRLSKTLFVHDKRLHLAAYDRESCNNEQPLQSQDATSSFLLRWSAYPKMGNNSVLISLVMRKSYGLARLSGKIETLSTSKWPPSSRRIRRTGYDCGDLNAQVVVTTCVACKLDDGLAHGIQAAAALQRPEHFRLGNQS